MTPLPLEDFNTQKNCSGFSSKEFKDSSFLRGYLRGTNGKDDSLEYVNFFSYVIESYSQLRGRADNENFNVGYFEILDRRGSLPIEVDSVLEHLKENQSDAPEEIISVIAQRHYNLIKSVGESLRKILRRERNKVSIGRAQQMDSQCLIWLSKQPGYTTAQKAGSKQEVLSVVRHESYDTLENRVFKDFLKLCQREGSIYYKNYKEKFPESKRVEDVRRLVNLAASILLFPAMSEISQLKSNPHPNYVLQKNVNYSTIWGLYQKLLRKYQVIEELWPYRHIIIREYLALRFDLLLYKRFKAILKGRYWIDDIQTKNKTGFLGNSFTVNYFSTQRGRLSSLFFTGNSNYMITIKKSNSTELSFPFYYIPFYEQRRTAFYKTKENIIPIVVSEGYKPVFVSKQGILLDLNSTETIESFERQILDKIEGVV